ncbi:MAG TPA: hypothetical protein VFK09_03430 [Gemmatimonadales bacterium]|nr:hypothetical protein [Gemmatimonadales bacterium]
MTVAESPSITKRAAFALLAVVGVPLLVFAVVEGASSLALLAYDLRDPARAPTERAHTDYDTLLGWVGRPHFGAEDVYGPGVGLHTNARGFRGAREVAREVPPGRTRVICSGDSFTLGWGVADGEPWCARLEARDPRLEAVNLGQGGYGVDQAYLWYMRDGRPLEHQAQVFAFILEDFRRMRRRDFLGFPKPVLSLAGDSLVLGNVPVPHLPYAVPRFTAALFAARPVLAQLRSAELVRRIMARRPAPRRRGGPGARIDGDSATWLVADRVLANLASVNRAKHSALLVVFLPMREDYDQSVSDRWRGWLRAAAGRHGFTFVDLVEAFRKIPRGSLDSLFYFPGAGVRGHYGPRGHDWVAERLQPYLAAALGGAEPGPPR